MDNIAANEQTEDNHLGPESDPEFERLLDAEEQKLDQESSVVTEAVESDDGSGEAVFEEGLVFEKEDKAPKVVSPYDRPGKW